MLFSTPAYAQAAGAGGGSLIEGLLPLVLIVVLFWFLIIRPQNKRQKEYKEMVSNVRRGDSVVTAGGVFGKVTKVKDNNELEVEIAEGVRIRVVQDTLSQVLSKNEPAKADAKATKEKKADKKADK